MCHPFNRVPNVTMLKAEIKKLPLNHTLPKNSGPEQANITKHLRNI